MSRPLQRISQVSEDQWGLVTRSQAQGAGVGWTSLSQLTRDGRLERVAHGVYRVRGSGEPDHQALRAAWLQLEPAVPAWQRMDDPDLAVVTHGSAAAMYGVGDVLGDVHEFTVPVRHQSRRRDVRFHRGRIPRDQWQLHGGLPVQRAAWMIGDLLADHVEPMTVAEITAEVLDRGHDDPHTVAEGLAPQASRFGLPRRDGIALLDHLLHLADHPNRAHLVQLAARA